MNGILKRLGVEGSDIPGRIIAGELNKNQAKTALKTRLRGLDNAIANLQARKGELEQKKAELIQANRAAQVGRVEQLRNSTKGNNSPSIPDPEFSARAKKMKDVAEEQGSNGPGARGGRR